MEPVLAFLTLADFLQFLRGQLHFSKRRGNETPNEIEVNLDLLCGLYTAFTVTLMHKDFLDKLIEHGNGQLVEVLVLVNQSDKTVSVLFVFFIALDSFFQTTQEVEIYFNFVGRFVPPAFGEVELTPEELEEIRKREERKDRLHQNYLKRKASGAQKRYEDKIKGRKKAEIEAKKAAIRAEDIAKGVFVPVSSLPQREPMKGAQIA